MRTIDLNKLYHCNGDEIVAFHIGRGGRFNNPGHCID